MKLTIGWKTLAKVKIQKSVCQEDAILPFMLAIAMMPLSRVFKKKSLEVWHR